MVLLIMAGPRKKLPPSPGAWKAFLSTAANCTSRPTESISTTRAHESKSWLCCWPETLRNQRAGQHLWSPSREWGPDVTQKPEALTHDLPLREASFSSVSPKRTLHLPPADSRAPKPGRFWAAFFGESPLSGVSRAKFLEAQDHKTKVALALMTIARPLGSALYNRSRRLSRSSLPLPPSCSAEVLVDVSGLLPRRAHADLKSALRPTVTSSAAGTGAWAP